MGLDFNHSSDSTTDFGGQNDREIFFGQKRYAMQSYIENDAVIDKQTKISALNEKDCCSFKKSEANRRTSEAASTTPNTLIFYRRKRTSQWQNKIATKEKQFPSKLSRTNSSKAISR